MASIFQRLFGVTPIVAWIPGWGRKLGVASLFVLAAISLFFLMYLATIGSAFFSQKMSKGFACFAMPTDAQRGFCVGEAFGLLGLPLALGITVALVAAFRYSGRSLARVSL